MKKVKFNIMAVAAMAIAFSTFAFKASEAKKANLVWFEISGSYAPTDKVAPADASYLNHIGPNPPTTSINCSGTSKQCISGFGDDQVDASNNLDGDQKPMSTPLRKP